MSEVLQKRFDMSIFHGARVLLTMKVDIALLVHVKLNNDQKWGLFHTVSTPCIMMAREAKLELFGYTVKACFPPNCANTETFRICPVCDWGACALCRLMAVFGEHKANM